MKKLLPPRVYLLAVAIIASSYFVLANGAPALFLLLSGTSIAIAGLAITIFHSQLFFAEKTNILTFNKPNKLIKKGLFRLSRNPMYLGFTLSLFGWALAFSTVIGWLVFAAFFLIADRWYIPFEEKAMALAFGEQYTHYCEETNRWFTLRQSNVTNNLPNG